MSRIRLTTILFLVFCCYTAGAQNDGSKSKDTQSSSSFINAASDSKPREISLGLPLSVFNAVPIFEDGMPISVNITPTSPFKAWHGGVSAVTGSIGPMESAMRHNEIGYFVYSTSKNGVGEKVGGDFSYTFGQYGQHKLDLNIHGPISNKGWYFSVSTYQNFDPGSNRPTCVKFRDRHQFYKGIISKDFLNGKGQMSLAVQYVDYFTVNEDKGPFYFVGDGSVKLLDGFNLGRDNYLPDKTQFTFMDLKTGEMVTKDLNKDHKTNTFSAHFNLNYNFDETSNLIFRSRFKSTNSDVISFQTSSVAQVNESAGFKYADGTPYSGNVQYRNFVDLVTYEHIWMNNAEYSKRFLSSLLAKFGADLNVGSRGAMNSSATYAHEVCANPNVLFLNGKDLYNYNTSGQYYEGYETRVKLYAHYDWNITERWASEGFIRGGLNFINGKAANNVGEDKSNTRYPGFNLTEATITDVKRVTPDWSAGFNVRYKVSSKLLLNIEPIFTSTSTTLADYYTALVPTSKPTNTLLLRGGATYTAETFNVSAQITYLSQANRIEKGFFSHKLTKDVGDMKAGSYETISIPVEHGISSIGLVVDGNWNPEWGFSLHGQLMLRNPRYKNFEFNPTFSDGVTEHYDFSGKVITAMPQIEFTLDPSYKIDKWRIWLTARYLSKEYVNKTNTLFFSGRIETFAGVDFTLNKHLKFKLNLINLLNQKGASGSIAAADLIEDTSQFNNYLMAGKFIRPFTVEIGAQIHL